MEKKQMRFDSTVYLPVAEGERIPAVRLSGLLGDPERRITVRVGEGTTWTTTVSLTTTVSFDELEGAVRMVRAALDHKE